MKSKSVICPRLLGLFQKRIDGDDTLLRLACMRFQEAGLGTEFYAPTPSELDWLLKFKPKPETPAVAHLHRGINLLEEEGRNLVMNFSKFSDRIFGMVVHDQNEITTRFGDYLAALRKIELKLRKNKACPYLFVEYAAGLEPEIFIKLFKEIQDLEHVSACIDIGHVGIRQIRTVYARRHPGKDVCAITPYDSDLPHVIQDVQNAVDSAIDAVLQIVRTLGALDKPLHFHLHDGHPLSTFSPFGVSDHLSFLIGIPILFEYRGKRSLDLMFGPSGLSRIVNESLQLLGPDRASFTLEIHPMEGRLPLDNASGIFNHWRDITNAERMNYWLSILSQNHRLLFGICESFIHKMRATGNYY